MIDIFSTQFFFLAINLLVILVFVSIASKITKISEQSLKSNNYGIAIISLDVSFTLTFQM